MSCLPGNCLTTQTRLLCQILFTICTIHLSPVWHIYGEGKKKEHLVVPEKVKQKTTTFQREQLGEQQNMTIPVLKKMFESRFYISCAEDLIFNEDIILQMCNKMESGRKKK